MSERIYIFRLKQFLERVDLMETSFLNSKDWRWVLIYNWKIDESLLDCNAFDKRREGLIPFGIKPNMTLTFLF